LSDPTKRREIDATRATAACPASISKLFTAGHRPMMPSRFRSTCKAVPSFEAFGRFVESASPFAFWAQAVQMAWLPWFAAAQDLGAARPDAAADGLGSDLAFRRRPGRIEIAAGGFGYA
jgi:hypothetical protein